MEMEWNKKFGILLLMIIGSINTQAQFKTKDKGNSLTSFFRMDSDFSGFREMKSAPRFSTVFGNSSALSYWQGVSYTSYSENRRISGIHSFDVQGQLRESRTQFLLKKRGIFSKWSVQFSPQRSRPFFVYTIK